MPVVVSSLHSTRLRSVDPVSYGDGGSRIFPRPHPAPLIKWDERQITRVLVTWSPLHPLHSFSGPVAGLFLLRALRFFFLLMASSFHASHYPAGREFKPRDQSVPNGEHYFPSVILNARVLRRTDADGPSPGGSDSGDPASDNDPSPTPGLTDHFVPSSALK